MTIATRAKLELAAAALIGLLALYFLYDLASGWRRALAIDEALALYHGNPEKPAAARGAVVEALARWPGDPELLALSGAIALKQGEPARAREAYASLAAEGDRAGAVGALGLAAADLLAARDGGSVRADADAIEREIRKGQAEWPTDAQGLEGALLAEKGDLRGARGALEQARGRRAPASQAGAIATEVNLGEVLLRIGEPWAAAESFARASLLAGARPDLDARHARALAAAALEGSPEGGVDARLDAVVERLRSPGRGRATPYHLDATGVAIAREAVGVAYARRGQLEDAKRLLQQAWREVPRDAGPAAVRARAGIGWNLGAVHLLRRKEAGPTTDGRQSAREAGYVLLDAAQLLEQIGEPDDAYEMLLAAAVAFREAHFHADAIKVLERTERIRSGDVRLLLAYALTYDTWSDGQGPRAVPWYKKVLERDPAHPLKEQIEARIRTLELRR